MLIDPRQHPVCETCGHPIWKEGPSPEVKSDEIGRYIICTKCGNKYYISKNKEL